MVSFAFSFALLQFLVLAASRSFLEKFIRRSLLLRGVADVQMATLSKMTNHALFVVAMALSTVLYIVLSGVWLLNGWFFEFEMYPAFLFLSAVLAGLYIVELLTVR